MRPFRFFFGLLLVAAAAFVLLKVLFFATFGFLLFGALFAGARAFRRFGPGYAHRHWRSDYPGDTILDRGPAFSVRLAAEPIDPRQVQRPGEPLAGSRQIMVV